MGGKDGFFADFFLGTLRSLIRLVKSAFSKWVERKYKKRDCATKCILEVVPEKVSPTELRTG